MSAGNSGAEICSTVFGSEYCLLYNDYYAEKALYMEEISPQAFRTYFDYVSIERELTVQKLKQGILFVQVYTACPNLRQSEELRTRLSDTLMNRRATLCTQQVLSSPKKR